MYVYVRTSFLMTIVGTLLDMRIWDMTTHLNVCPPKISVSRMKVSCRIWLSFQDVQGLVKPAGEASTCLPWKQYVKWLRVQYRVALEVRFQDNHLTFTLTFEYKRFQYKLYPSIPPNPSKFHVFKEQIIRIKTPVWTLALLMFCDIF